MAFSPRRLYFAAVVSACFLLSLFYFQSQFPIYRRIYDLSSSLPEDDVRAGDAAAHNASTGQVPTDYGVTNSTLGFEKILAIGLPERSDRREMLSNMTQKQDVKLDWMDAVKGADLPKSSYPKTPTTKSENKPLTLGEIGNWRSHMNALQKVVDAGYTSALIIEDDADWDVTLKSQLTTFADAAREIEGRVQPESNVSISSDESLYPYGTSWDILWLGACTNPPAPEDAILFPGVGPEPHFVYPVTGGIACTFAYGVTNTSAPRLMSYLDTTDRPTDFTMSSFCGESGIRCLLVWPMLISTHKAAGSSTKDSDIAHGTDDDGSDPGEAEEIREKGFSWKIEHSAIQATLDDLEDVQDASESPIPL